MNNLKPITRTEHFMGRAAGNPGAEKLTPITREERFLDDIVEAVEGGGEVTPGSVVSATAAMTPEQAAQTIENLGIPMAVYPGVDLTVKFATEIANYTDEWAWVKARIQAGNYAGININDYIPVATTNNYNFKARVMGINTYKGYGNTEVGNHIDWWFDELWPTTHAINPVGWNNGLIPKEDVTADGTATSFVLTKEMYDVAKIEMGGSELIGWSYDPATYTITFEEAPAAGTMTVTGVGTEHPWLASEGYLWLNSLAGHVVDSSDAPPNTAIKRVDYTQGGVYFYLPQKLKDVIVEKQLYLEKRYNSSSKLNASNAAGWANIGKLWLPTELEVCGTNIWGGNGYPTMGSINQYPIFRIKNRVKKSSGSNATWRLLTPYSSNSTHWVCVLGNGSVDYINASYVQRFPVCFRIA